MNALRLLVLAALILATLAAIPGAVALQPSATAGQGQAGYCAPTMVVGNIGGLITGGEINVCVSWQHEWTTTDTTHGVALAATATTPAGTLLTFTWSFPLSPNGCTIPASTTTTTNGPAGAMSVRSMEVFRTSAPRCDFIIGLVIAGGLVPQNIAEYRLPINIVVPVIETFDRFCGTATNYGGNCATGATVGVSQSGAWSMNIPDVAAEIDQLRVDLCDNPSGHGHCSLDIHGGIEVESPDIAAALADVAAAIETLNRLRVQVCGYEGDVEAGACSIPRVHVENFTANVGIGNQSVSFPSNLTVAATFPGDVDAPGFDFWALFIFWVVLLGFLLYQGWYFAAAFAVPGLLDAMFPGQIPETFATWFVFVMLGCVLEVAASKFRWGAYRQKSGMRA